MNESKVVYIYFHNYYYKERYVRDNTKYKYNLRARRITLPYITKYTLKDVIKEKRYERQR